MYAAAYQNNRTFALQERATRRPGRGEVRVHVACTCVCGTDLHIFYGDMDARVSVPAVIGHEMSGRVAEIGTEVSGWGMGDAVTVIPLDWCGS